MNNVKKNNKGFSLVELIVVVLIMAIIAVSLAPQVMKWVDRSRQANDASDYYALVAAAQMAVIAVSDYDGNIEMKDGGTGLSVDNDAFEAAMEANLPGWTAIEITSTENSGETYTIEIDGTVITTNGAPDEISAS